MELWQQIVIIVISPSVIIAFVAYLMKKYFERGLERDLEKYKSNLSRELESFRSELEIQRIEYQTKYSIIHEKRAKVIGTLYGKIQRTHMLLSRLVGIFQPGGQSLPEKKQEVGKSYSELNEYFHETRIYLDKDIEEKTESLLTIMWDAFINFHVAQDGEEYEPDTSGLWVSAYEETKTKLPPLLEELENRFREVLGVPESSS